MKSELRLIYNETAARMATASVEDLTAALDEVGQHCVLVTPNLRRLDLQAVLKLAREKVLEQQAQAAQLAVTLGREAAVMTHAFGWVAGRLLEGGGVEVKGIHGTKEQAAAVCQPGDPTWFVVPVKPGQTLVVGEKWPGLFFPADYQKALEVDRAMLGGERHNVGLQCE